MRRIKTHAGSTFGDWTAIEDCFRQNKLAFVKCRCVCGTVRTLHVGNLRSGKTNGCGCKHGERISASKTRHGLSDGPEHIAWQQMRKRCNNRSDPAYANYGARGIFVCERWSSFENFLADMGPRPKDKQSIDRINNDGPYSPENCRWANYAEQAINKRNNRRVLFRGVEMTIGEIAKETGINPKTLATRFYSGRPLF